jgi:hypothetical protein
MGRWTSTAIALGLLLLTGCGASHHGSAEPLPDIHVTLVLRSLPSQECCLITLVNPSDQKVNAYCRIRARKLDGAFVYRGLVATGPAGFFVDPGRSRQGFFFLPIRLSHVTYSARCDAVVWHGEVPI